MFTIIFKDPSGASFIENQFQMKQDPRLHTFEFQRDDLDEELLQ